MGWFNWQLEESFLSSIKPDIYIYMIYMIHMCIFFEQLSDYAWGLFDEHCVLFSCLWTLIDAEKKTHTPNACIYSPKI